MTLKLLFVKIRLQLPGPADSSTDTADGLPIPSLPGPFTA